MCDASQSQSGLRQVRKKSTRYLSIEDPRSLFLHTLEEQTEAYLSTDIQTNPQHYGQNEILAIRARSPRSYESHQRHRPGIRWRWANTIMSASSMAIFRTLPFSMNLKVSTDISAQNKAQLLIDLFAKLPTQFC